MACAKRSVRGPQPQRCKTPARRPGWRTTWGYSGHGRRLAAASGFRAHPAGLPPVPPHAAEPAGVGWCGTAGVLPAVSLPAVPLDCAQSAPARYRDALGHGGAGRGGGGHRPGLCAAVAASGGPAAACQRRADGLSFQQLCGAGPGRAPGRRAGRGLDGGGHLGVCAGLQRGRGVAAGPSRRAGLSARTGAQPLDHRHRFGPGGQPAGPAPAGSGQHHFVAHWRGGLATGLDGGGRGAATGRAARRPPR